MSGRPISATFEPQSISFERLILIDFESIYAIPPHTMRQQGASLCSIYIPRRLNFKMYMYFAFGKLSADFQD